MTTGKGADRQFVHSRLIDAAPAELFSAFAQPQRLARWWGPDGFSSAFEVFDLRPGGCWRFMMHGPDGTDYPNEMVFRTLDLPNRVELEHISEEHYFILNIVFASRDGKSLVGWVQTFDTVEQKQQIAAMVEPANGQNLDRLPREVALLLRGAAGLPRREESPC